MALFKKPAIGLDISDHSIEAVLIVKKRGRPTLVSYGRVSIPPGIVVDGYVEKRSELSLMIRKLLADQMSPSLPKKLKRVVFALPESQIFSHVFEVPRIAEMTALGQNLAYEADSYFPYTHEDLIAGYTIMETKPDVNEIYYAATQKETLKTYISVFKEAKLEPIIIEGESSAIARALLTKGEKDPVVLLDIGAKVSELSVFDHNGNQFSESLSIAGDAFTESIASSMNLSFGDADEMKKNLGVTPELDPRAMEVIVKVLDRLVEDVKKAIAFYEKRTSRKVNRLVLCGGSALMPGLQEYFTKRLLYPDRKFRVNMGDPWQGLDVIPELEKQGARSRGVMIATGIGLALRGGGVSKFSEINFLNSETLPIALRQKKGAAKKIAFFVELPPLIKVGLGALLVLGVAFGIWQLMISFYTGKIVAPPPEDIVIADIGKVKFEFKAKLGNSFSDEKFLLRATPLELENVVEKTFEHAGTEKDGTATGTVELINVGSVSQALIVRTRLLSESGALFRLIERVTVPANGSITAEVRADVEGETGNIPPSSFIIPGLRESLQSVVYAESAEAMSGGLIFEGDPLSAEQLEVSKTETIGETEKEVFELLVNKGGDEFIVLDELRSPVEVKILSAPEVDQPTGEYTIKLSVAAKVLGISREELESLISKVFQTETGEIYAARTHEIIDMVIQVENFDSDQGEADLTISGKVKRK